LARPTNRFVIAAPAGCFEKMAGVPRVYDGAALRKGRSRSIMHRIGPSAVRDVTRRSTANRRVSGGSRGGDGIFFHGHTYSKTFRG
jgi:hypothetical protein